MRITHLALNVKDPERSEQFYINTLGLAGTANAEEWGVRLRLDGGFMLALIKDDPLPGDVVGRVHFGCDLPSAEAVVELRARLSAEGVAEVAFEEEPGYTSVKVRDPDGYVVELAWDVQ